MGGDDQDHDGDHDVACVVQEGHGEGQGEVREVHRLAEEEEEHGVAAEEAQDEVVRDHGPVVVDGQACFSVDLLFFLVPCNHKSRNIVLKCVRTRRLCRFYRSG